MTEAVLKLRIALLDFWMDLFGGLVCEMNDKQTKLQGRLHDIYNKESEE